MAFWDFLFEKAEPQRSITPSFENVFQESQRAAQQDLRVAMPGQIIDYDFKKQSATVQPLFPRKYKDGTLKELPQIYNVPVACPRAGNAFVHMPLKKGDSVLLVFADRSMDKWLSSGGSVDPADTRLHHISDAIAYPGLYPFNKGAAVTNGDDIIIRNGNTIMHVKANNHLQVINGTTELVDTLCDLIRAIREAVTYTCGGPEHLYHPKWAEIEQRLRSFLEIEG